MTLEFFSICNSLRIIFCIIWSICDCWWFFCRKQYGRYRRFRYKHSISPCGSHSISGNGNWNGRSNLLFNQQSRKKGGTSKSVYCGSCVAVNCHKCFCNNHIFLFEQFPFKAVRSRKSASFFGRGLYFYYCVRRRFTDYRNWFSSVHP